MTDIFREPSQQERTAIDKNLTDDKAVWLDTKTFNPVRHRLVKTNQAEVTARQKERKDSKIDGLFCGSCYVLETQAGQESSVNDYDVMQLKRIEPLFEKNKLTGLQAHTGFSLEYTCSERGHRLCKQVSVGQFDKLTTNINDKKILSLITTAQEKAREEC